MIGFKGERFYLGTYDTMEKAVQARIEAEKEIHEAFVKRYHAWRKRRMQIQSGEKKFALYFG